ncbi:MAG TPA: hypothetical protein DCS23_02865 [Candidatus Yonathbacteria bacterium]|nr:hypothetical protein [Candidatus Yonathbacteria bacterium]
MCVEVAQAGYGHIVSGCYSALHDSSSDDDPELLLADDGAQPFWDNEYVHNNSISTSDDNDEPYLYPDAKIVAEECGYRGYQRSEDKHPPPRKMKKAVSVCRKPDCYETVSSAHHRIQAWLVDKTSKYPMVFGHLRIT